LFTKRGHGELGLYAWPSTKSKPVAEYSIVFRVSAPIAFDAVLITVLASCAAAGAASQARSRTTATDVLTIAGLH
jgi:hypothetical protein